MTLEKQIEILKEWHKLVGTEMYLPIMSSEDIDQFLHWLEDYKQLKADYADLDNRLRTANTENDELKRLLRLAADTMDNGSCSFDCQKCERLNYKGGCGYGGGFKWRHHDEAMELLGGNENDNG